MSTVPKYSLDITPAQSVNPASLKFRRGISRIDMKIVGRVKIGKRKKKKGMGRNERRGNEKEKKEQGGKKRFFFFFFVTGEFFICRFNGSAHPTRERERRENNESRTTTQRNAAEETRKHSGIERTMHVLRRVGK